MIKGNAHLGRVHWTDLEASRVQCQDLLFEIFCGIEGVVSKVHVALESE